MTVLVTTVALPTISSFVLASSGNLRLLSFKLGIYILGAAIRKESALTATTTVSFVFIRLTPGEKTFKNARTLTVTTRTFNLREKLHAPPLIRYRRPVLPNLFLPSPHLPHLGVSPAQKKSTKGSPVINGMTFLVLQPQNPNFLTYMKTTRTVMWTKPTFNPRAEVVTPRKAQNRPSNPAATLPSPHTPAPQRKH